MTNDKDTCNEKSCPTCPSADEIKRIGRNCLWLAIGLIAVWVFLSATIRWLIER